MTAAAKDEPAFPSHGSMGEVAYQGMTLLDYFAAAALPLIASKGLADTPKPEGITIGQHVAQMAYAIAGRMMQERERGLLAEMAKGAERG